MKVGNSSGPVIAPPTILTPMYRVIKMRGYSCAEITKEGLGFIIADSNIAVTVGHAIHIPYSSFENHDCMTPHTKRQANES